MSDGSFGAGALALFTALWPFGGDPETVESGPTLEALEIGEALETPAAAGGDDAAALEADLGAAIERWRALLALEAVPPELRLRARERLAALELRAGLADRAAAENETDLERGGDAISAAAQRYRELLSAPGGGGEADDVARLRYQLARAEGALGRTDAELEVLEALVRDHPDDPRVPEARFRIGERRFLEGRFAAAARAYAEVIEEADAGERFREQALYKLAWAEHRLGDDAAALGHFLTLLDEHFADVREPELERLPESARALPEDALRASALVLAGNGGSDRLDALLEARDRPSWGPLLHAALAGLYAVQERWSDAADAFAALPAADPDHRRAPRFDAARIDVLDGAGFADEALEARRAFVDRYALDGAWWTGRTPAAGPPRVLAVRARDRLRRHLAELASHDHALAGAGDADARDRAVTHYRALLAGFPADEEAGMRALLLGELLEAGGDPVAAAEAFGRSAFDAPEHPRAADAAYAAVLALTRAADASAEHEPALAAATRRFAATFPEDPRAVRALVIRAERAYAGGDLAGGVRDAASVLGHVPEPDADATRRALRVLAHGRFELGLHAEAETTYDRLLGLGIAPERRAEFERRRALAIFRRGEAAREAGRDAEAIDHFLRLADTAPGSEAAAGALYDAGVLLVRAGEAERGVAVLARFERTHPDHELRADSLVLRAGALREIGRTGEAATALERLADLEVDGDARRRVLREAAVLRRDRGEDDAEAYLRERILSLAGPPAALREIPDDALRAERRRDALGALTRLLDLSPADSAPEVRRRWLEAAIAFDERLGAERTDRSRTLAGRARLELAAPLADAFRAVPLDAPLDRSLPEKRERMEAALDAYGRAARSGIAEVVTRATYEIGRLYRDFARALLESERPDGLSPAALAQYEILLEEQAFPFEEQALDAWRTNAARTARGYWDPWVRESYARLAELAPARWDREARGGRDAIALHQ